MFRMVPFAFSVEKSTPTGKKYTSGACGAGDKLQLCVSFKWDWIGLDKQYPILKFRQTNLGLSFNDA